MTLSEQDVPRVGAALVRYRPPARSWTAQQTRRSPPCANKAGMTMVARAADTERPGAFTGSRDRFETMLTRLEAEEASALSHGGADERPGGSGRSRRPLSLSWRLQVVADGSCTVTPIHDATAL